MCSVLWVLMKTAGAAVLGISILDIFKWVRDTQIVWILLSLKVLPFYFHRDGML